MHNLTIQNANPIQSHAVSAEALPSHHAKDLVALFNRTVGHSNRTVLQGGGEEPFYRPIDEENDLHQIHFTRDYFASVLHEVAHWCIAGEERRQLPDYGYWYAPDGRDAEQQNLFETVEVKPQALEWVFASACGFQFKVSVDNLTGEAGTSDKFKAAICKQAQTYCANGLPKRAQHFVNELVAFYDTHYVTKDPLNAELYRVENL